MTSIYREALGADFERLHPKMQWRFGFSSIGETSQVGTGVMDEVWRGPWWTLPFLLFGSTRRVLFPSCGRHARSRSSTTPTSTASVERRSRGRAGSTSLGAPERSTPQ
jgi:hypothetical protein